MAAHPRASEEGRFVAVHPAVFWAGTAMAAGMSLAVVAFLGRDGQLDYLIGIVALFTLVSLSLPFLLARLARSGRQGVPFPRWRRGELEIFTGRMRASEAALLILIAPLASVVGLAALCLIALLASRGAF
ncbi:MAG: hypothetical protein ACYC1L_13535 [Alphaproteobacteria bacterium]